MGKRINQAIKNPLISGSAVVFFGSLFSNFFNFLFNVFMNRNLTIVDYGTMASLVSIIMIYALVADSFMTTVVHFAAQYFASGEIEKAQRLFLKLTKLTLGVGVFGLIIFFIFSKNVSHFFNIQNENLIVYAGFSMLFAFVGSINRAFLRAKLAFVFISLLSIFGAILKLLVGVVLVFLGFGLYGAIWSFFITFFIQYLLTLIPLRSLFSSLDESKIHIKTLLAYGTPAMITILGLASFVTTDIILVKHFFSAREAGIYAGFSLLGRIIYFFSSPISIVMFPLIVRRRAMKEKYTHLFKTAVLFTLIASTLLTLFYYLFPEFSIRLLLKREAYLVVAPILWYFGLYMIIYSVLSVFVNFFLSVRKTKIYIPIAIGTFLQALLIWFFHDSFTQIISISILVASLVLIVFMLYYWRLYGSSSTEKNALPS